MAHSHLVYGRRAADYLIELGIKPDKITVCYNGIEIDHLLIREEEIRHAGQVLRDQEVGDQSTLFLYVGGMIPEKKVDLLIQSFMQLRKENEHCKLWLVGDGPERLRLGEIVKELNIPDITFWGRIVDGVDHYFAAADYFVLPGTGGLALNQALFWRVPCVVGEADGTEDDLVIDKVTGFRFQPEDPQSLQCALQKCLLLNCQERHVLGEEGGKLVVSRSNVSKMVQIFWSTLGKLEVESATIPAPACTNALPYRMTTVRMAMQQSRLTAKSR